MPKRNPAIEDRAWALAQELNISQRAEDALNRLAARGLPTALNAKISDAEFVSLSPRMQQGLRALWTLAIARGLREEPLPNPLLGHMHRQGLDGVDTQTVEFAMRHLRVQRQAFWIWLRALRDANLPTDLNLDFEATAIAGVLVQILGLAELGQLKIGSRSEQGVAVRRALRSVYTAAEKEGRRQRPIAACLDLRRWQPSEMQNIIGRLPLDDQRRMRDLAGHLRKLSGRQQDGMDEQSVLGMAIRGRKKTLAQSSAKGQVSQLHSFLHHAARTGGILEEGLDCLLTPRDVAEWAYRGQTPTGDRLMWETIKRRTHTLPRLLGISIEAGPTVQLVTPSRLAAINEALESAFQSGDWNVCSREIAEDDGRLREWRPLVADIERGLHALDEWFDREGIQYDADRSRRRYWLSLRDYTIATVARICVMRRDTVATLDLSRCVRHPETGKVRWPDNSIRIRFGARAKQVAGRSYHVEVLYLPPAAADALEKLLNFEGRSLEKPLADGESSVTLRVGQKWGSDVLLTRDREVIPAFRKRLGSPEPLAYAGIGDALSRMLLRTGWPVSHPHAWRKAGAIHWRFSLGLSARALMTLGLWSDEQTMSEEYAHLADEDIYSELSSLAPSRVTSAEYATEALDQLVREVQIFAVEKLRRSPSKASLSQARQLIGRLGDQVDRVLQGSNWHPATPSQLTRADAVKIEMHLNARNEGLRTLLGRDVLAGDWSEKQHDRQLSDRQSQLRRRIRAANARSPRSRAA